MTDLYVLDRLVLKPVKLTTKQTDLFAPKTWVVYIDEENNECAGTVLWYETPTTKKWTLLYPLEGEQKKLFDGYQTKASDLYKIFKQHFPQQFPEAIPLTARMNLSGTQIYFYFFAETRFQFSEFVKTFRQQIGYHFFLYQVGARDRVRLHPHLDERYDPSGLPLMYHIFKHPLPNVETDVLPQQQLEGRSIDKLKDRSGKLDHTLAFELDRYSEEIKKYPPRWSIVQREGKPMKCMGFNLLTQEIKLRWQSEEDDGRTDRRGEWKKITLADFTPISSRKL